MDVWPNPQNLVDEKHDYNLFATDLPLQQGLQQHGLKDWAALHQQGEALGRAESYALAEQADRHPPEAHLLDSRGRRLDQVAFHPAWHHWMGQIRHYDIHSLPFARRDPAQDNRQRWLDWAARFYQHSQLECGSLCPAAMTLGAIPVLQREPDLWPALAEPLLHPQHDARDLPLSQKTSLWIGMGMTEKQGGSDVRSNQTTATPIDGEGRGAAYLLHGHKWFFSAPMCDAHLVVARTPQQGLGCFWVPRWQPDGRKNPIHIQRLKSKVGNRSNASSEVEFAGAWGQLIGEPGRGIPTIIEMATYTRLTCVVGSSGILRQALVQALSYARQRHAFGRVLAEQPMMQAVLTDLALESEASLALALQLAAAYGGEDPLSLAWQRLMTPAAKFWVCKRAVELTGEAMEVLGGNGYVEGGVLGRLFREAPVNSIWEGSGNIMCLDVLRGISRQPDSARLLLEDLLHRVQDEAVLRQEVHTLGQWLQQGQELEAQGRAFVGRLAKLAQAALLRGSAPSAVADAFIASRYAPHWGGVTGQVHLSPAQARSVLQRALAD